MDRVRWFEFIWLPTFERSVRKLLDEKDLREIEATICGDLEAGVLMQRTGGFRKLRVASRGRGKRGGARVIYLLDELCECVYMIVAYSKGRKESLTNSEENELRQLARRIKHEEH
jgi:hypothetical protein